MRGFPLDRGVWGRLTGLLAVALVLAFAAASHAEAAPVHLSGEVTGQTSGGPQPLSGAEIVVEASGSFVASALTDVEGKYELEVEAGIYDVGVIPPPSPKYLGDGVAEFDLTTDRTLSFVLVPFEGMAFVSEKTLFYLAAEESTHAVVVKRAAGGGATISDSAGVTAGENCTAVTPTLAKCLEVEEAVVFGGSLNDALTAQGALPAVLVGEDGNDRLTGSRESDLLAGEWGNDAVNGGAGNDCLGCGPGLDTVRFGAANSAVEVNLEEEEASGEGEDCLEELERVVGSGQSDTIIGDFEANTLLGGGGDDQIDGGEGNDTLSGGPGDDVLTGGLDFDSVSYAASLTAVNVDLAGETATGEGSDTLNGDEGVIGSSQADTIAGDANPNVLAGRNGTDLLDGGDKEDTLRGGAGTDELFGGAGKDKLFGEPDDDDLDGGPGVDFLDGGTGLNACVVGEKDRLLNCDLTPTTISELTISPASIDTSEGDRDVIVTARIADASGVSVEDLSITIFGPACSCEKASGGFSFVSGSELDGIYEAVITIPQFSAYGTWHIHEIALGDNSNNKSAYSEAALKLAGFTTTFQNG
jgi:Ca2+-binding RTX toxin-like protein